MYTFKHSQWNAVKTHVDFVDAAYIQKLTIVIIVEVFSAAPITLTQKYSHNFQNGMLTMIVYPSVWPVTILLYIDQCPMCEKFHTDLFYLDSDYYGNVR